LRSTVATRVSCSRRSVLYLPGLSQDYPGILIVLISFWSGMEWDGFSGIWFFDFAAIADQFLDPIDNKKSKKFWLFDNDDIPGNFCKAKTPPKSRTSRAKKIPTRPLNDFVTNG
jgi:hypothetical protein